MRSPCATVLVATLLLAWRWTLPRPAHPALHNPLELFATPNLRVQLHSGTHLAANTSLLTGTHGWVEVHWSGVPSPAFDDYVALYPAAADPQQTAPIKYMWAARAPGHLLLGSGALSFHVLHVRQNLRFALVRNGLEYPVVAAWSKEIRIDNPNEPMQGHLSLTGKPGEVAVQWTTRDEGQPRVKWSRRPGDYPHTAPGDSLTYAREDMCGAPANATGWVDPGTFHLAVMGGLEPSKEYFYVYGDEEFGWSQESSFVAPPEVGPGSSVSILAVADLGQAEEDGSMEMSEMLPSLGTTHLLSREEGAQLLLHNGDISYARGFSTQWDRFWEQLGPVVRRMPYMTGVGNHERDWPHSGDRFPAQYDSGGECGVPYYRRTRMPTPAEDQPWYSFDFGPVHFLQYSTEHLFEPGSPQYEFILRDLQSVNRSLTPWLIVGGHRPMYIDSTFYGLMPDGDQFVARQLRDSLEPLLYKFRVDATWHGHHHSYQRTCPVYKERCMGYSGDGAPGGPVHLIIGHAGAGLTPNIHFWRPRVFETVQLRHGYMRVEANATHMSHRLYASLDGSIMDEFTLTKPLGWQYSPREEVHEAHLPGGRPEGARWVAAAA